MFTLYQHIAYGIKLQLITIILEDLTRRIDGRDIARSSAKFRAIQRALKLTGRVRCLLDDFICAENRQLADAVVINVYYGQVKKQMLVAGVGASWAGARRRRQLAAAKISKIAAEDLDRATQHKQLQIARMFLADLTADSNRLYPTETKLIALIERLDQAFGHVEKYFIKVDLFPPAITPEKPKTGEKK